MMKQQPSIADIFMHDRDFKKIMVRLFETTMDQSFDSILISEAKPGYPIVYVNKAFSDLTGYTSQEVLGKSPAMFQGPNTDRLVLERLSQSLREGRFFHGEAVNYRKDGSEFIMEWKIVPIRNENDKATHYLAIQRDVTHKRPHKVI
jgi:PAS domain S-box-containing protein